MLSITSTYDGRFKFVIAEGESVCGPIPPTGNTNPRGFFKPDIKTFLNFDKEWKGASVRFLEENYRSTGTIIRAAAAVAKNNRFRTPKNLWTQNPDGDPIVLFEAWGENEEAEWIAQQI